MERNRVGHAAFSHRLRKPRGRNRIWCLVLIVFCGKDAGLLVQGSLGVGLTLHCFVFASLYKTGCLERYFHFWIPKGDFWHLKRIWVFEIATCRGPAWHMPARRCWCFLCITYLFAGTDLAKCGQNAWVGVDHRLYSVTFWKGVRNVSIVLKIGAICFTLVHQMGSILPFTMHQIRVLHLELWAKVWRGSVGGLPQNSIIGILFVGWLFGGQCSGLPPVSVLRDHFWYGSGDPIGCQGLNLGPPHERQMPYLLYYLLGCNRNFQGRDLLLRLLTQLF